MVMKFKIANFKFNMQFRVLVPANLKSEEKVIAQLPASLKVPQCDRLKSTLLFEVLNQNTHYDTYVPH